MAQNGLLDDVDELKHLESEFEKIRKKRSFKTTIENAELDPDIAGAKSFLQKRNGASGTMNGCATTHHNGCIGLEKAEELDPSKLAPPTDLMTSSFSSKSSSSDTPVTTILVNGNDEKKPDLGTVAPKSPAANKTTAIKSELVEPDCLSPTKKLNGGSLAPMISPPSSLSQDESSTTKTRRIIKEMDEDLKLLEQEIEAFKNKPKCIRPKIENLDLELQPSSRIRSKRGNNIRAMRMEKEKQLDVDVLTQELDKIAKERVIDETYHSSTLSPITKSLSASEPISQEAKVSKMAAEEMKDEEPVLEYIKPSSPKEFIGKEVCATTLVPTITDEMREFKLNKKLDLLEEDDEENAPASSSAIKKDVMHEISEELREIRETLAQKFAEPAGTKAPGEMYRCRFCGLSYNYMTTLRAHERVHDVDEPYVCSRCGLSYRYYAELQAHSLDHKGEKGYKCECGRVFAKYYDLLYHSHPDDEPQIDQSTQGTVQMSRAGDQPNDDLLSAKVPAYSAALAEKHYPSSRKAYYCQFCCKAYATSHELKYHLYSHRGERKYSAGASRYRMDRL